jgi:hypothetical protein
MNHVGYYGNAVTIQDIADWAGVSVGTVYNCTNCIMITIALFHNDTISWNLQNPKCLHAKAIAKKWVERRICRAWKHGYLTTRSQGYMRSLSI